MEIRRKKLFESRTLQIGLVETRPRSDACGEIERQSLNAVVLPFAAKEYRKDFADNASRGEFDALLGQASRVLVLDGNGEERNRAYEAAGVTLRGCDSVMHAGRIVFFGAPGAARQFQ